MNLGTSQNPPILGFNPLGGGALSHTPLAPHQSLGIQRMVYVASPSKCRRLAAIFFCEVGTAEFTGKTDKGST